MKGYQIWQVCQSIVLRPSQGEKLKKTSEGGTSEVFTDSASL